MNATPIFLFLTSYFKWTPRQTADLKWFHNMCTLTFTMVYLLFMISMDTKHRVSIPLVIYIEIYPCINRGHDVTVNCVYYLLSVWGLCLLDSATKV